MGRLILDTGVLVAAARGGLGCPAKQRAQSTGVVTASESPARAKAVTG